MTILIDNGHGKETPGKRSPDGSFREYAWTREVARMVCDIFQAEGYDARLLVPEEKDISLQERCRRANAFDKRSTILVSLHNDAAGNGSKWMKGRGWSIWTTRGVTESDTLAESIYQRAVKTFAPPLKVRISGMTGRRTCISSCIRIAPPSLWRTSSRITGKTSHT